MAVGCTGGRHRSVAIACQLAAYLRSLGYGWSFLTGIRTTGGKGLFCRKKDADAEDSRRRSREIRNAPGTYAEKHGRRIPW